MAAVPANLVAPKKKPINHADRLPRDGLTGMGFATQKHFIEIQQKMFDYLSEQEAAEYDGKFIPSSPHHHHHHQHLDQVFVDGKRPIRPRPPTSDKSRKPLVHHESPIRQSSHRGGKTSSSRSHTK
jgi:hypothetical protein